MEALNKADYKTTKIPDNVVVNRVLDGEKELFEILVRRYNQTLYRAVRSYLKSEKDIEDTMQDTYLKAFRKLHQFKNDAAFSTWLVRIGINEALQRIRKRSKVQSIKIAQTENDTFQPESRLMNPENKTIQDETRTLLEKAVDQLPEKYRVVYVLREIERMDNKSIAECLELNEGNVKVRFHRSKKLLKEILCDLYSNTELFEFGDSRCDKLTNYVMQNI